MLYFSIEADYSLPLTGAVRFTPMLTSADKEMYLSGQAPQQGFDPSPRTALFSNGVLNVWDGGTLRLFADDPALGLSGPLIYRVDFFNMLLDYQSVSMGSVQFNAPTSDVVVDLTQLAPAPVVNTGGGGTGAIADGNKGDITVSGGGALWQVNPGLGADKIVDGTLNRAFSAADDNKLAGIAAGATVNATNPQLRDRSTHTGTQSADTLTDGSSNKVYTTAEQAKLATVAPNASANSPDSALRDRSTHTGMQTSATISDLTEAVQDTVAAMMAGGSGVTLAYDDAAGTLTITDTTTGGTGTTTDVEAVQDVIGTAMSGIGLITVTYDDAANTITISTAATQNATDAALRDRGTHTGTQSADTIVDGTTNHAFTAADDTKLGGIEPGATANATDVQLRDRATHTGTQDASTISNLTEAVQDAVAAMLVQGTNVTLSYDDAAGTLAISSAATGGGGTNPSFSRLVGDGTQGPFVITHNLNTEDVGVQVRRATAPKDEIDVRVEHTGPNSITLLPDEAWAPNQYKVLVWFIAQSNITPPTAGTLAFSSSTSNSLTYTFTGQADADGIASIDLYNAADDSLIAAGVTSPVTWSGLTAQTAYSAYLKVTNVNGNSATSNTVTHSTDAPPADSTPPTAGALSFSSVTQTTLVYTYTLGSDNVGVTQIDAYDSGGTLIQADIGTSGTWTRTGLTANTSYGTFLRYRDAAGLFADSNTVTHSTSAPPSGISYIDSRAEKTASSLSTMPTHQAGDLLVMFAYRDGFNTPPSVPAGWTVSGTPPTGTNSNCMTVASKVAASSAEVSGTWTNATNLACIVFRGVAGGIGAVAYQDGIGTTLTIPALTLQKTDGTSWVVAGAGDRSGANSLATPPSGMVYRTGYEGTGTEQDTAVYGTNGAVSSFAGGTISYATSTGWFTCALELKAA